AQQRHYVGDGSNGDEVQQRLHRLAAVRQQLVGQSLDQLEGHARAAQVVARIGAVGAPWVDQGVGAGQLVGALVMVGDDQVDAKLAGQIGGFVGGGAAVGGDDHLCAGVSQLLDDWRGETVAVDEAVGQAHVRIDADHAQACRQDGGRIDAVGVVVGE